jgi:hypothetical protein
MSAPANEANGSAGDAPEKWEDADFIRALASLERLQNQVRYIMNFRFLALYVNVPLLTIHPSGPKLDTVRIIPHQIINSLTQPHRTPEIMFQSFRTAAWEGSQSLERLKQSWEDPQTKALVEKTIESEKKDPDLTPGRSVDLWGWPQKKDELSKEESETKYNKGTELAEGDDGTIEDLWVRDDKATMKINVKGKAVNLDFIVTRRLSEGSIIYDGECIGERQENLAISRCLASRKRLGDLKYLLVSLIIHVRSNCGLMRI